MMDYVERRMTHNWMTYKSKKLIESKNIALSMQRKMISKYQPTRKNNSWF